MLAPLVAAWLHTVACAWFVWRAHREALQAREDASAARAELCEAREQRAQARSEALVTAGEIRRLMERREDEALRAADMERRIGALNRLHLDLVGTVSDEGAILASRVLQLRIDIDEERRHGSHG